MIVLVFANVMYVFIVQWLDHVGAVASVGRVGERCDTRVPAVCGGKAATPGPVPLGTPSRQFEDKLPDYPLISLHSGLIDWSVHQLHGIYHRRTRRQYTAEAFTADN